MAMENVSANNVVCTYISEIAKGNSCITEGKHLQLRGMVHIMNLVLQDGIKQCSEHVDKA